MLGDQREIELLVEAGFTPVQAVQIATENDAKYLGQYDRIGTLAPGMRADLTVVDRDLFKDEPRSILSGRSPRQIIPWVLARGRKWWSGAAL